MFVVKHGSKVRYLTHGKAWSKCPGHAKRFGRPVDAHLFAAFGQLRFKPRDYRVVSAS